jgi:hypothetical protein
MKAVALGTIVVVGTGSINSGRRRENREGGKKEKSPSHRVLLVNGSGIGSSARYVQIDAAGKKFMTAAPWGNSTVETILSGPFLSSKLLFFTH